MSVVTGFDFPFAAMGSVHVAESDSLPHRPIAVSDTVDVRCTADPCASTARGCWSTWSTDVNRRHDTAWQQDDHLLHQQRTSLVDEPKPEPKEAAEAGPAETRCSAFTPGQIRPLRAIGGDQIDSHVLDPVRSCRASRTAIAHGMYSAASGIGSTSRGSCRTPSNTRCASASR